LPKERDKWIEIYNNKTILQKCAWWCSLRGEPTTDRVSKIRIKIPESNLLTSRELQRLMKLVKDGDVL
jgi:hypothetical protein